MALFTNRFEQGLYLLDEPEAALSPQRQLSFLRVMHDLATPGHAQFIVATHSPILLAYPGAALFSLDGNAIAPIEYRETRHYLITRDFLNAPERFFKHLFGRRRSPKRRAEGRRRCAARAVTGLGMAEVAPFRLAGQTVSIGRPVNLQLDGNKLTISRHGRGPLPSFR